MKNVVDGERFAAASWPLATCPERDIEVTSNVPAWDRRLAEWRLADSLGFRPHFGWTGAIEWRED